MQIANPIYDVYDVTTNEEINEKETFIESLTHDSFVIQIPQLRSKYQTEVELLLSVFDQSKAGQDHHLLNINEDEYPEKYQPLIRRLIRAIAEPKIRQTMDVEDQVLADLEDLERKLARKEDLIQEQSQALQENAKALQEKDQIIAELQKRLGL